VIGRERLDAILRARKGTLEETPYPIVLLALAVNEKSAVLQLRRNQLEKQIVFDAGSPVECRSNIATETLGRFLMSNGKISEADCHTSLSQSASRGVPLGEVLVERKLLKPTDLYRALQQNLGRKLLEPFSWKSGTFEISFDAPAVSSALRVKVPQLIVTGIVKVDTQESADEAAAAATGKYLSIAAEPLFGLDEVRLSGDQQKVVEASRRGLSFDDIRAKSGIDAEDVNRIAAALLLLGVVNVTDRPVLLTAAAKPKTVVAEPAVRAPTAAAADEVIAAFLSYPRKDAFDLLAVAEDAAPPLIMQAFLQLADKFLPSKFDERAADALRDKAQQVFLAAARAYAELSDAARREALVKKRVKLREQAAAAAKAGTAALIDPEQLCRNGRALAEAGKLREALSSFELAAECDAQNGTYSAEAAWCRFQLRVTPAANALKLLKNAIRIDPECAVAYLYAGKLQAVLGHRLEAEAYLNRAAMLMPKDLRVVDALKALR
jgi:tetratricopeptide (TPR) repeat protein